MVKIGTAIGLGSLLAWCVTGCVAPGRADDVPLVLESTVPLGAVPGRIDHLAYDPRRRRLFVAELGNGSVGVVDIAAKRVVHRINGLHEPQGLEYVAATDTVYVANGGDGSVRMFDGIRYRASGRVELGSDADNIRFEVATSRLYVGHGDGGVAVIDIGTGERTADIRLPGHPEGFQLDPQSHLLFANVPNAGQVAVIDRAAARIEATWRVPGLRSNFPMAVDPARNRVVVGFRHPARLVAFRAEDGAVLANVEACGDADDIFVDPKRDRVYMSCGEGYVDVFRPSRQGYERIGHIHTTRGARTALFVRDLDRLFLAVPRRRTAAAAIWVFRPALREEAEATDRGDVSSVPHRSTGATPRRARRAPTVSSRSASDQPSA